MISPKCALLHGMTFHDTDQFFLNQLSRNTLMFVMKKQSKAQSFRFWHDWFQDLDQKYTTYKEWQIWRWNMKLNFTSSLSIVICIQMPRTDLSSMRLIFNRFCWIINRNGIFCPLYTYLYMRCKKYVAKYVYNSMKRLHFHLIC